MSARTIHVAYTVKRDEDGGWSVRAEPHPGVVAYGDGDTRQAALDELREGIIGLVEEFGAPEERSVTEPTAA